MIPSNQSPIVHFSSNSMNSATDSAVLSSSSATSALSETEITPQISNERHGENGVQNAQNAVQVREKTSRFETLCRSDVLRIVIAFLERKELLKFKCVNSTIWLPISSKVTSFKLKDPKTQITSPVLQILKSFSTLTDLRLNFCSGLTNDVLSGLNNITTLRRLELRHFEFNQNTYQTLQRSNWPALQYLDFSYSEIQDLSSLTHLTALQHLILKNCAITDEGLSALSCLTNLQSLNLYTCHGITGVGLSALSNLTNFRSLNLESCASTNAAGLAALSTLTTLQELLFFTNQIDDAGLLTLSSLTSLKILKLTFCERITNVGLRVLSKLHALRELYFIDGYRINDDGLRAFTGLGALQKLCLSGCDQITGEGVRVLSNLTALEDLDLRSCNITDPGLRALSSFSVLKRLKLYNNHITGVGLEALDSLTALRNLELDGKITDNDLPVLSRLTALQILNLSFCEWGQQITGVSLSALSCLSDLRSLCLAGTGCTDAGLSAIVKLTTLRKLDLGGCEGITDNGLYALGKLTTLEKLRINNCHGITYKGLLQTVSNLMDLQKLDLSPTPGVLGTSPIPGVPEYLYESRDPKYTAREVKMMARKSKILAYSGPCSTGLLFLNNK